MPGQTPKQNIDPVLFAEYLGQHLGSTYQVDYIKDQNMYHVRQDDPTTGVPLTTNFRVGLDLPSSVKSTYGGKFSSAVPEISPELFTADETHVITSGPSLQASVRPVNKVFGPYKKADLKVVSQLRGPTENFANWVRGGFERGRQQIGLGTPPKEIDVLSNIINIASEGVDDWQDPSARGSLLNPIKNLANRLKAAKTVNIIPQLSPRATTNRSEIEQRDFLTKNLLWNIREGKEFQGIDVSGSETWREIGMVLDRDNENRLVPLGTHSKKVTNAGGAEEILTYVPTPNIMKHQTIVDRQRDQGILMGEGGVPLESEPIPQGANRVGFRQSTATLEGRIPQEGLLQNVLFSTQYLAPGSGAFFGRHMPKGIKGVGFEKNVTTEFTSDIRGLLAGRVGFRPSEDIQIGEKIPSTTKFNVGEVMTEGSDELAKMEKDDSLRWIGLEKKTGAAGFVPQRQKLVIPKYTEVGTGLGAKYDPELLKNKLIEEVTQDQADELAKRTGLEVELSSLATKAAHRMTGVTMVGAKFASGGIKSGLDPSIYAPFVSYTTEAGKQSKSPITTLTFEAKALPETALGAIGALPARRQQQLLEEYQTSLTATGDVDKAAAVQLTLEDIRQKRAQDKGAKLDLTEMASLMDMPTHEMGKDIFERIILQGEKADTFKDKSQAELEAFAQTRANQRNLERYQMGWVSQSMTTEVKERYDPGEYRFIQQQMTQVYRDKGMSEEDALKEFFKQTGFSPDPITTKQGAVLHERTYRPEGLMMPQFGGLSVEHPGGGVLGREELEILNQIAPEFAQRIGASQLDINSAASMVRKENIRNPVRWASAQAAQIAMIDATESLETFDIPKAITIDRELARRLHDNPRVMELLGEKGANLKGLQEFTQLFTQIAGKYDPKLDPAEIAQQVVRFGFNKQGYLPSLTATRLLTTEDVATMDDAQYTGEDQARIWNRIQKAWSLGIEAQINQGNRSEAIQARSRVSDYFMETYGLPGGFKKNSVKTLFASDIEATKGRYSYHSELAQNEVYASRELFEMMIRREAQGSGVELDQAEVNRIYKSMTAKGGAFEEGVPGYMLRYPQLGGEASAFAASFVTPTHLARTGRRAPDDSMGMASTSFRMGMPLSSVLGGDFDWDMMMGLLGLTVERDDKGKIKWQFAGAQREGDKQIVSPEMQEQLKKTRTMQYEDIQKMMFPDTAMAKQFNPLYQTILERDKGGLRGIAEGLMAKQFAKSDYIQYGTLVEAGANYRGAKRMMAQAYDYDRMQYGYQAASGNWTQAQLIKARDARASMYQPFLDLISGQANPMTQMFQTAFLDTGEDGKVGLSYAQPARSIWDKLKFVNKAHLNVQLSEEQAFDTIGFLAGTATTPMLRGKGDDKRYDYNTPMALASAFSPEGELAFKPDRGVIDQQKIDKEMAALEDARSRNAPESEIRAMEKELYQKISLEEAIQPAFDKPLTKDHTPALKTDEMTRAVRNWMEARYADNPAEVFKGALVAGMIGKSITKERKEDPTWVPDQEWSATDIGKNALALQRTAQPIFDMMRGRTMPADQALRFMTGVRQQQAQGQPLGTLMNWALGNVSNILGFGDVSTKSSKKYAYQQVMGDQLQLHAGTIPQILGEVGYYGKDVLGREYKDKVSQQRRAMMQTVAYSAAGVLGVGGGKTYDFIESMFPRKYLDPNDPDAVNDIERGKETEAKLASIAGELGYFQKGEVKKRGEQTGMPHRGAIGWTGTVADVPVHVSGTPDFLRAYRDDKGNPILQILEQKSPGATIDAEGVLGRAGAAQTQAMTSLWIMSQLREQALLMPEGKKRDEWIKTNIRAPLAQYFTSKPAKGEKESLLDVAEKAVMAGNLEAQALITQEGTPIYEEIQKGSKADLVALEKMINQPMLDKNKKPIAYGHRGGQRGRELAEHEMKISLATQMVELEKEQSVLEIAKMGVGAGKYWVENIDELSRRGESTARAHEMASLQRQYLPKLRAMGQAAAQVLGLTPQGTAPPPPPGPIPVRQSTIPVSQPDPQAGQAPIDPIAAAQAGMQPQTPFNASTARPAQPGASQRTWRTPGRAGQQQQQGQQQQAQQQQAQQQQQQANQPDPNAAASNVASQTAQYQGQTVQAATGVPGSQADSYATGMVMAFERKFNLLAPIVAEGADRLRASLGVTATGTSMSEKLLTMPTQEILTKHPEFAQASVAALELYKGAEDATKHLKKAQASKIKADLDVRTRGVMNSMGLQGIDIQDLIAFGGSLTAEEKAELSSRKGKKPDLEGATPTQQAQYVDAMTKASQDYVAVMRGLKDGTIEQTKAAEMQAAALKEAAVAQAKFRYEDIGEKLVNAGMAQRQTDPITGRTSYSQIPGMGDVAKAEFHEQLVQLGTAERDLEAAEGPGKGGAIRPGKRVGSILRSAMSGFGMMYAQRILGYVTGGLDRDTSERQAIEMQMAQTTGGALGYAEMPYNQAQRFATQRALMGQEQGGMAGLVGWATTTPGIRDLTQMGIAGLGTFSATQWIAGMGPKDAFGNPAKWAGRLASAAPAIAGAVAIGQFMLGANQRSGDAYGVASQLYQNDQIGFIGSTFSPENAWAYHFANKEEKQDIARAVWENKMVAQATERGYSFNQMSQFMQERQGTFGQYTVGQFNPLAPFAGITSGYHTTVDVGQTWTPRDRAGFYQVSLRQQIAANPQIDPATTSAAFRFGFMAGLPQEQTGAIAERMATTGFDPSMLQGLLRSQGAGFNMYDSGQIGRMWNLSEGMDATDALRLQAGTQAYGEMGLAAATFSTRNYDDEMRLAEAIKLGDVAGTLPGQNYIRDVILQSQRQQLGWFDFQEIKKPTGDEVIDPIIQGQKDLQAKVDRKEIDHVYAIQEAMMGWGATEEEIFARGEKLQGASLPQLAKILGKQQRIERMTERQRYLEPERDEDYFRDFARSLQSKGGPQLDVLEQVTQQATGLMQMATSFGVAPDLTAQIPYWQQQVVEGKISPEEFRRYYEKSSWGIQMGQNLQEMWGFTETQAQAATNKIINRNQPDGTPMMSQQQMQMIQGTIGQNPFAMTQYYAAGNNAIPGLAINPFQVTKDIWGPQGGPFEGLALNAAPFTVSGASNPLFPLLQAQMGEDFFQSGIGAAFAQGYQMEGTNIPPMAGMLGLQMYQMDQTYKLQQAQLAQSGGGIALQREYLPKIWGLQDQMRDLGWEQQQWNFGRQQEGLQMQARFQVQNWGMQEQQRDVSRMWAKQDWAFQDQQRAQNWQWRTEDFQENLRFMTGRDRRLAERQMSRETISKGQEDEQIDKQRSRQEELWAMEDQRFEIAKAQYMENMKFQEEGIKKQKEFYEERFKLEKQLTDLQRELQMKQLDLAGATLAIQAKIMEENRAAQELQMAMQVMALLQASNLDNAGTDALDKMIETFINAENVSEALGPLFEAMKELLGGGGSGGDGGMPQNDPNTTVPKPKPKPAGGTASVTVMPNAWGNLLVTDEDMLVGESGPERLTLSSNGSVYSHKRGEIRPTMYDPWNTQQIPGASNSPTAQAGDTVIVVNVGNEELKRFVIKSVAEEV